MEEKVHDALEKYLWEGFQPRGGLDKYKPSDAASELIRVLDAAGFVIVPKR